MFLKRMIFLLVFLSISTISNNVSGQETGDEYILKTYFIEELANEFPIFIEDSMDVHSIYKINWAELDEEVLKQFARDPRVISFSPNHTIQIPPVEKPRFSFFQALTIENDWGFRSMNFPQNVYSRNTVDVAILDTGIDTDHPLLKTSIKNGYDALFNKSVEDDNGHGTHVAGIIALNTPQIHIVPIKTLDQSGKGDLYTFVRGIYYAIDHDVDVINMSFGMNKDDSMVREAVDEAIARGISIVAAAGNNGSSSIQYPARYEDVIAVGAYDQNEGRAYFSQYGEGLDFVAPGKGIWSSWLMGEYLVQSGTSMAAPFITKTIALLKSVDESLSPAEIDEILTAASSPLASEPAEETGHGKVDVAKTLELVDGIAPAAKYDYFPSKFNVSPAKDWKIQMSLPLDVEKFDNQFIRVMDQEGNTVETSIVLDKTDRTIIHVFSPTNGYEPGKNYELYIEKG